MFIQRLICTEKPSKRDLVLLGKSCQPRKEGFKSRAEQNVLNVTVNFQKKPTHWTLQNDKQVKRVISYFTFIFPKLFPPI